MLSSFISRRKVKNSKLSLLDAALRRTPSYAPLEVQSDQEGPRFKQWSKTHVPTVTSLRSSALHRQSSPKVHLDFDLSDSNDWFPQEILAPPDEDDLLPIQSVPQCSVSSVHDDVVIIGPPAVSFLRFFCYPRVALILIQSKLFLKPNPSPALPPLPAHDGPSPIEPGHDVCRLMLYVGKLTLTPITI
jgi:hypothetical protein